MLAHASSSSASTSTNDDDDAMSRASQEVLKRVFGFDSYKSEHQERALKEALRGRDVLAVMATGSGKSLIFQAVPFVLRELGSRATVFVVSPLIALMRDQVASINAKTGLNSKTGRFDPNGDQPAACFLGPTQLDREVEGKAFDGEYALVYITPEKLASLHEQGNLARLGARIERLIFAIDECHCISDWGHDFRTEYRKLRLLKELFPENPIIAATATATPRVRMDVITNLRLVNPAQIIGSFNRPNLEFQFLPKKNWEADIETMSKMIRATTGQCIVYCKTRRETEIISTLLRVKEIVSTHYHAGLPDETRSDIQHVFMDSKIHCIVCTIAFGMGIDKSDVRLVVNYGLTDSIEAYVQQTGRAGRDGEVSKCLLFFGDNDLHLPGKKEQSASNAARTNQLLQEMSVFARGLVKCRRQSLLEYFGEIPPSDKIIGCAEIGGVYCDVCTLAGSSSSSSSSSVTQETPEQRRKQIGIIIKDCQIFLKAIAETGGRFGFFKVIRYLCGNKDPALSFCFDGTKPKAVNSAFGRGKSKTEAWWKQIFRLLQSTLMIETIIITPQYSYRPSGLISTYNISRKGTLFMNTLPGEALNASLEAAFEQFRKTSGQAPDIDSSSSSGTRITNGLSNFQSEIRLNDVEQELFSLLREIRMQLSKAESLESPYIIFQDATLKEMASYRPIDEVHFLSIYGVGDLKTKRYGAKFMETIKTFSEKHSLAANRTRLTTSMLRNNAIAEANRTMLPSELKKRADSGTHWSQKTKRPRTTMSSSAMESFSMFQEKKMDIEQIAQSREIVPGTVINHLAQMVASGQIIDFSRIPGFVPAYTCIEQVLKEFEAPHDQLTMVVENLPCPFKEANITLATQWYPLIRLVRAIQESGNQPQFQFQISQTQSQVSEGKNENCTTAQAQPLVPETQASFTPPFIPDKDDEPQPSTSLRGESNGSLILSHVPQEGISVRDLEQKCQEGGLNLPSNVFGNVVESLRESFQIYDKEGKIYLL